MSNNLFIVAFGALGGFVLSCRSAYGGLAGRAGLGDGTSLDDRVCWWCPLFEAQTCRIVYFFVSAFPCRVVSDCKRVVSCRVAGFPPC